MTTSRQENLKTHWKKSSEGDSIIPHITLDMSGMIKIIYELWIHSQKIYAIE